MRVARRRRVPLVRACDARREASRRCMGIPGDSGNVIYPRPLHRKQGVSGKHFSESINARKCFLFNDVFPICMFSAGRTISRRMWNSFLFNEVFPISLFSSEAAPTRPDGTLFPIQCLRIVK